MSHCINISVSFNNDDDDDNSHYMALQDSSFEEEMDAIIANMKTIIKMIIIASIVAARERGRPQTKNVTYHWDILT